MGLRKVVYIYPDIAFAVSLLMNGLILWGTARINKITAGKTRIIAGAAVGALYSFAAAFPTLEFLHGVLPKILCSVAMFAVSFAPVNLKKFFSSLVVFYIVSFALGGFFIGVLYFLKSTPFYQYIGDISNLAASYFLPGLIITVGGYVLLTRFAGRLFQKKIAQNMFRVPMKVLFGESHIEVDALVDTGNQLQDPLSQIPVVVVEYNVLKDIFPAEIQSVFENTGDPDLMQILNSLSGTSWSTRFRVIPFTSLGRENGLLIGFRPDRIEVSNGDKQVCTRDVIVGIYQKNLSPEGDYRALLHPDVLDNMTA